MINIVCLQATKKVGAKYKEIETIGYMIFYTGTDRYRNGIGIIVDKNLQIR